MFFSDELVSDILKHTNSKLQLYLNTNRRDTNNTYFKKLTFEELQAFLGLLILVGVLRVNREPLSKLYCDDPNFSRPIFKSTMARERFKTILRFIRFDDYQTRLVRMATDRLAPIRDVLENVRERFKNSFNPHKFVTVDEHMCGFRGRCPFRQFIPTKPDRYGIKIFIIADSLNFYPINIEVYTGKTAFSNKPEDIVLLLV